MSKNIKLTGDGRAFLQLRAEAFNVLNHPVLFVNPNGQTMACSPMFRLREPSCRIWRLRRSIRTTPASMEITLDAPSVLVLDWCSDFGPFPAIDIPKQALISYP